MVTKKEIDSLIDDFCAWWETDGSMIFALGGKQMDREEMIINILKREDTRLLLRDVINYHLSDIKTWERVEERKVLIDIVRVLEGRV